MPELSEISEPVSDEVSSPDLLDGLDESFSNDISSSEPLGIPEEPISHEASSPDLLDLPIEESNDDISPLDWLEVPEEPISHEASLPDLLEPSTEEISDAGSPLDLLEIPEEPISHEAPSPDLLELPTKESNDDISPLDLLEIPEEPISNEASSPKLLEPSTEERNDELDLLEVPEEPINNQVPSSNPLESPTEGISDEISPSELLDIPEAPINDQIPSSNLLDELDESFNDDVSSSGWLDTPEELVSSEDPLSNQLDLPTAESNDEGSLLDLLNSSQEPINDELSSSNLLDELDDGSNDDISSSERLDTPEEPVNDEISSPDLLKPSTEEISSDVVLPLDLLEAPEEPINDQISSPDLLDVSEQGDDTNSLLEALDATDQTPRDETSSDNLDIPEQPLTNEMETEVTEVIAPPLDQLRSDPLIATTAQTDVQTNAALSEPDLLELEPSVGMAEPPFDDTSEGVAPKVWYLGIDIGTTGISAVLLNRVSRSLYPISWSVQTPEGTDVHLDMLRLPTLVHLSTDNGAGEATNLATTSLSPERLAIAPIAPVAATVPSGLLLRNLKPYLRSGIPHFSPQTSRWEPILQWSDSDQVPLSWVQLALRSLLSALSAQPTTTPTASTLTCQAMGLEPSTFQTALRQLAGITVGYPANWSDTYSFNVREVILGARLVTQPEHICFVEDSIATLLSSLKSAEGQALTIPADFQEPDWQNANWQGGTLVINAGATVTELALVTLPEQLQDLTYQDFAVRSLFYAGNAIDQDIICQLFYPAWTTPIPDPRSPFTTLGLDTLTLPKPGDPDPINRARLQQRLESSLLGRSLLDAARHLKLTLQRRDRFTLKLSDQQWIISRPELGSRVFLPYIQRLNRELNALLAQTGMAALSINQVICTGGTASLGAIARWLRQKLPNATILQDTYTGVRSPSPQENSLPVCSRVAYGLATLPLHPHIINLARQQYSDYFLLLELLRAFPSQPVTAREVMQLLERRGINVQACHLRILALLEGHLPPGLVPTDKNAVLFTPESRKNPDYVALQAAPLFIKQDNQTYRPNYDQWNRLRLYLDTILTGTHQQLVEPLLVSEVL